MHKINFALTFEISSVKDGKRDFVINEVQFHINRIYGAVRKKWIKNPRKLEHSVIEQTCKEGKLSEEQYSLIQYTAGLVTEKRTEYV